MRGLIVRALVHSACRLRSSRTARLRRLHGVWRAKINGDLSHVGWFSYRKTYWRELSVNYMVDAVSLSCEQKESH